MCYADVPHRVVATVSTVTIGDWIQSAAGHSLRPDAHAIPATTKELNMKFAICQELFEDMDWAEQCRLASEIGYTGLEVAPFTIADQLADVPDSTFLDMKSVAQDHGLEIIGLHWLLAKTTGLHLTSADAAVRGRTTEYLKLLARICGLFGGGVMVFGSPFQRSLQPGVTREQAMDYAAGVFQGAVSAFAEHNAVLCMEPLTLKETDFVNTCADAVKLMEAVDHPSFVLHQDVKAMLGAETDSVPELIHRYRDVCGHFHVNDTNLLGPGMGETDYEPILRALLESNYDGWVSVEVFDYSPGAEKICRDSLEYMQRVLAQIGAP